MERNILILHPEGNLLGNPNLSCLIKHFLTVGFHIDYCTHNNQQKIYQEFHHDNFKIVLSDTIFLKERCKDECTDDDLKLFSSKNYSIIIAIDKSLYFAGQVAVRLKIPLVFLSYEIYFTDEIPFDFRKKELEVSKLVQLAFAQDYVRSKILSMEYNIPFNKIYSMPVAGCLAKPPEKGFIHRLLNIPTTKKIALIAGSLGEWGMTKELLKSATTWSNNWVLVIHDRLARKNKLVLKFSKQNPEKILFTNKVFVNDEEFDKFISSADVGLAFYKYGYDNDFDSKNLLFIGLSSGKINTYLKNGVPVICNYIGELSEYIQKRNLGTVLENIEQLSDDVLDTVLINSSGKNCIDFFSENLDMNLKLPEITLLINQAIDNENIEINKQCNELLVESLIKLNYITYANSKKYRNQSMERYKDYITSPTKLLKKNGLALIIYNLLKKNRLATKLFNLK